MLSNCYNPKPLASFSTSLFDYVKSAPLKLSLPMHSLVSRIHAEKTFGSRLTELTHHVGNEAVDVVKIVNMYNKFNKKQNRRIVDLLYEKCDRIMLLEVP